MTKEKTEAKKRSKPSIIANWLSLIGIISLIIAGQIFVERHFLKPQALDTSSLSEEIQIVLEENHHETTLEESETIHVPTPVGAVAEIPPAQQSGTKPTIIDLHQVPAPAAPKAETKPQTVAKAVTPKTAPAPKMVKTPAAKKEKQAVASVNYHAPDPYTNGSEQDLDRKYTQEAVDTQNTVTIYRTTATGPNARDYFIALEETPTKN